MSNISNYRRKPLSRALRAGAALLAWASACTANAGTSLTANIVSPLNVHSFAIAQTGSTQTSAMQVGIFSPGAGCLGLSGIASFGTWLGKPVQHVSENWTTTTWAGLITDVNYDVNCYKPLQKNVNFTFGLPMLPGDGVSTLAQGAAGSYDVYFLTIAKTLVANGYSNAIIRVGPEFNGSWFPWTAYKDPQHWVVFYQRIVTVMRSVPGQNFKFDWCPSAGSANINPNLVYPGDAYVDYIGLDLYDASWNSGMNAPAARWTQFVTEPNGLQWQVNFAAQHHKLLSLPEWGCCGDNAGDDPYFVNGVAQWTKSHGYSYIDYWNLNSGGYNGTLTNGQYPQAAKAFISDFH